MGARPPPDIQNKVRAEAIAIGDRELTPEDVPALKYTVQVLHEALKRGVFQSVVDLQLAINRFVAETNADPKPFVLDRRPQTRPRRRQTWEASGGVNPLAHPVSVWVAALRPTCG